MVVSPLDTMTMVICTVYAYKGKLTERLLDAPVFTHRRM